MDGTETAVAFILAGFLFFAGFIAGGAETEQDVLNDCDRYGQYVLDEWRLTCEKEVGQ